MTQETNIRNPGSKIAADAAQKKKKQNPGKKNTEALAIALRANLMRRKTRERAAKATQINIDSEG